MTANDRKKILDWIDSNKRVVNGVLNDFVYVDDLTAFIESLSTEDADEDESYRESDYLH
jgi:hypothetical protein